MFAVPSRERGSAVVTRTPHGGLGVSPTISYGFMPPSPFAGTACLVALLVLAGGCASPVDPAGIEASASLPVTATTDGLVLVNRWDRVIHALAAERGTVPLLDFIACTTGPQCFEVPGGASRVLPWSRVVGYAPDSTQYTVFYWATVVARDGSLRPDTVRRVTVTR